jgi:hypothetical protein
MKGTLGLLLLLAGGGAYSISSQDSAGERPTPPAKVSLQHPDPKFSVTLPDGYAPLPVLPRGSAYGYQRDLGAERRIVLSVTILDGRIDPGDLSPQELAPVTEKLLKQFPAGAQLRMGKEIWKEHPLDTQEITYPLQGVEVFTLTVQFPTLPRAVQISMVSRRELETELRGDLKKILRSFSGTTHWLTPNQRLWAGISGGFAILSWLLLLIYGFLYALRYRGGDLVTHWRFRVTYLTATLAMFAIAIFTGVVHNSVMHRETMDISVYVLTGVALACAIKTGDLYKKGLELRQKAAAATPPAP